MKKLKKVCWFACAAALLAAVTFTLTSCGEDEPTPKPDGQEQVDGPNDTPGNGQDNPDEPGNENPTPDDPGNVATNIYGTDLPDEACRFVGRWQVSVLNGSWEMCFLPNGKGVVIQGELILFNWSYDAKNNLLITTFNNLQFVFNGIFEDEMSAVTIDGRPATWSWRGDCVPKLQVYFVGHTGYLWRTADGKKIYFRKDFTVDGYDNGYGKNKSVTTWPEPVTNDISASFDYYDGYKSSGKGTITIKDAWTDHPVMTIVKTGYGSIDPPFPLGTLFPTTLE